MGERRVDEKAEQTSIDQNGGTTLETTPLGRVANFAQNLPFVPQNNFTYSAWAWLSTAYAQGAQGAAILFWRWSGISRSDLVELRIAGAHPKGVPIVTVPYL